MASTCACMCCFFYSFPGVFLSTSYQTSYQIKLINRYAAMKFKSSSLKNQVFKKQILIQKSVHQKCSCIAMSQIIALTSCLNMCDVIWSINIGDFSVYCSTNHLHLISKHVWGHIIQIYSRFFRVLLD
jgi:hypothetical protein